MTIDLEPSTTQLAQQRLSATRSAITAADEAHRQAIRDLVAEGMPKTEVAAALRVSNRKQIYALLEAEPVAMPDLGPRPAVFLRGAGVGGDVWDAIAAAMHSRGWTTVLDRTQAWHLARARVPVVLVDFSSSRVDQDALVGRVKARYATKAMTGPVSRRLTAEDRRRLEEEGAQWMATQVHWEEKETDLPLSGQGYLVPVDPDELARAVALELVLLADYPKV